LDRPHQIPSREVLPFLEGQVSCPAGGTRGVPIRPIKKRTTAVPRKPGCTAIRLVDRSACFEPTKSVSFADRACGTRGPLPAFHALLSHRSFETVPLTTLSFCEADTAGRTAGPSTIGRVHLGRVLLTCPHEWNQCLSPG